MIELAVAARAAHEHLLQRAVGADRDLEHRVAGERAAARLVSESSACRPARCGASSRPDKPAICDSRVSASRRSSLSVRPRSASSSAVAAAPTPICGTGCTLSGVWARVVVQAVRRPRAPGSRRVRGARARSSRRAAAHAPGWRRCAFAGRIAALVAEIRSRFRQRRPHAVGRRPAAVLVALGHVAGVEVRPPGSARRYQQHLERGQRIASAAAREADAQDQQAVQQRRDEQRDHQVVVAGRVDADRVPCCQRATRGARSHP